MMLRVLVLVATLLAGLGVRPGTDTPPSSTSLDLQLLRHASLGLRRHTPAQILGWLRSQTAVRSAMRGADGRTLDIRFRDGMHSMILPASVSTVNVPASIFHGHLRSRFLPHSPSGRAVVLEPFATQLGLGPNVGDAEVADLQAAGFQVNQAYDTAVSVSSMTALSQYNLVYMQTHSGLAVGGEGVVATGEPVNGDPSVAPLIQNGSVVTVAVSGGGQAYYAITSRFILLYEGQFPLNSLVFFNGCNLLSAPVFWQALASKGVATLVSWDEEATAQDNYFTAGAFFTQMDQGQTVASAIAGVLAAGYGKSSVPGRPAVATLGYLGDGTLTLQRIGGSGPLPATVVPTSTPNPTNTPVAPATATAIPTRTLAPPPPPPTPAATAVALPLQATLIPAVAPGARQVITIRSRPDTILHLRITFPNGVQRTAITATDSTGRAKYAFNQPPSEITHLRHLARVAIQAIKGQGSATLTKSYRVKFGAIDVSAEPRQQAAGRMVSIWVHARAHTRVLVSIQTPQGQISRRHRVSGAAGWVHARYRIGVNVKPRSVITVWAQAQSRPTVQSRTTITVT